MPQERCSRSRLGVPMPSQTQLHRKRSRVASSIHRTPRSAALAKISRSQPSRQTKLARSQRCRKISALAVAIISQNECSRRDDRLAKLALSRSESARDCLHLALSFQRTISRRELHGTASATCRVTTPLAIAAFSQNECHRKNDRPARSVLSQCRYPGNSGACATAVLSRSRSSSQTHAAREIIALVSSKCRNRSRLAVRVLAQSQPARDGSALSQSPPSR